MSPGHPEDVSGTEAVTVVVGRIGRAHGIRGEVTVEVRTDEPDVRFAVGTAVRTEPVQRGPLTVTASHWHSGRLLMSFAGVATRDAAEALRGTLLLADIPAQQRPTEPDEYYDHQLVGSTVVDLDGAELGVVGEVVHLPGQDLLAVRPTEGAEFLVPFVAALVPDVDLAGRRVVVDLPPGLRDDSSENRG
jgi:16S rRNA processing protein RimM